MPFFDWAPTASTTPSSSNLIPPQRTWYWAGTGSLDASPLATDVMGDWEGFIVGLDAGDEEYAWCLLRKRAEKTLNDLFSDGTEGTTDADQPHG